MLIKRLQNMILVILMITVLMPYAAGAQDDARTTSNQTLSQEELAQMLAPIALYPDALLTQVLMAATYPFEVVEADRWLTQNPYITGEALDEALSAKDWDVSVLALCHYPKVLAMMSDNLSWTAGVGDAFANQEQDVMDTIQELRARARAAGNLSTTSEQVVIVEDRYIRIDPVSPDYIYIPAYDPFVVYGTWWLPLYPPVAIFLPGLVVTGPGIIFSPRFYVGFGVFGWSRFNWHDHHVVIVNIDRTRRYNRRFHDYRGWEHRPWRPDRDRRYIREKRRGEIPRYRPPVHPAPDGKRWNRKPGDMPAPDKRKVKPVPGQPGDRDKKPDFRKPGVIDRDIRPVQPRPGQRDKIPLPGTDRRIKQPPGDQPVPERNRTPDNIGPRVIDRNKNRLPEPVPTPQNPPAVRDRSKMDGIEPWNRAPGSDSGRVKTPPGIREGESRKNLRVLPQEERPEGAQRFNEQPERGRMNSEGRRQFMLTFRILRDR